LLFAIFGARVRQPIAGHMLLHRSLLEQLDVDALPDDFGVDVMVTLTALRAYLSVGQAPLVAPDHPSKPGNSERVMIEVATALLGALSDVSSIPRPDVTWPDDYWGSWAWPHDAGTGRELVDAMVRHGAPDDELSRWLGLDDAGAADLWSDHLADAVRRVRSRNPDVPSIVGDLVVPFFSHAERRARRSSSVGELERYIAELGRGLSARLHG
jgi:hypothetical protein